MPHALNRLSLAVLTLLPIGACTPDYSPNTYSSNAVQLANKVEAGVVVGYREVMISSSGNVGAVTGGAAGGILGAQYGNSALAAIGGTAVGSMVGSTLDHAAGDTRGWEYIIRKGNGDMLSVTQREETPLALGQKVLVIIGPQARVVPDYSVVTESPPPPPPKEKAETKPESNVKVEVVLSLPPGATAQPANGPALSGPSATAAVVPVSASGSAGETPPPAVAPASASVPAVAPVSETPPLPAEAPTEVPSAASHDAEPAMPVAEVPESKESSVPVDKTTPN